MQTYPKQIISQIQQDSNENKNQFQKVTLKDFDPKNSLLRYKLWQKNPSNFMNYLSNDREELFEKLLVKSLMPIQNYHSTLDDLLKNNGLQKMKESEFIFIAQQIVEAVSVLHDQNLMHRNLQPCYVYEILTEGRRFKIGGLQCVIADNNFRMQDQFGKGIYQPPEQVEFSRDQRYDKSVDIWALGCIFFEMLTGGQLFRFEEDTKLIDYFTQSTQSTINELIDQGNLTEKQRLLLQKMLQISPSNRVTISQVSQLLQTLGIKKVVQQLIKINEPHQVMLGQQFSPQIQQNIGQPIKLINSPSSQQQCQKCKTEPMTESRIKLIFKQPQINDQEEIQSDRSDRTEKVHGRSTTFHQLPTNKPVINFKASNQTSDQNSYMSVPTPVEVSTKAFNQAQNIKIQQPPKNQ